MAKAKAKTGGSLATVRASIKRIQNEGERVVGRLRRDAQTLVSRSRSEVVKEVRHLERRVLRSLHAATEEQVTRLERRIAKLEAAVGGLRRQGRDQAA